MDKSIEELLEEIKPCYEQIEDLLYKITILKASISDIEK